MGMKFLIFLFLLASCSSIKKEIAFEDCDLYIMAVQPTDTASTIAFPVGKPIKKRWICK